MISKIRSLAGFAYRGIARLKPGVSIATADADVARLLDVWMDSWRNCPKCDTHFYRTWKIGPALRPMKDEVLAGVSGALWVVMGTIGVVMLIACTNIANLLLVRADSRQQELAVRAALGAGRGRIVRELLIESMLLGILGGAGGTAVAAAGLRLLLIIDPANLPRLSEDQARRMVAGLHTGIVALLRTVLRVHSRRQVRADARAGCAPRRWTHS